MSNMTENVFAAALAGLLHDIGKPLQRNDKGDYSRLSNSVKSLQTLVGRGNNSYSHCLWTAQFFENENVNKILFDKTGLANTQELAAAAFRHHNPDNDNILQQIIKIADCASAGTDREPTGEEPEQNEKTSRLKYYERPLQSIFSRAVIEKRTPASACFHDACSIVHDNAYNPSTNEKAISYTQVVNGFLNEFNNIGIKNNRLIFLDTVASLVEKWFSCVPSSTVEDYADIPLSDHLFTTSAIAAVLCRSWEETNVKPDNRTKLLIVAGDFSGIQNFIFTISGESGKHAAKLIRGRSFMVNMYCKLAARLITEMCGLPPLCCINSAAGKFTILLPDTPEIKKKLNEAIHKITEWTYNKFFGDLKVLIDEGEPFTIDDFKMDKFRNVLYRSGKRISKEREKCFEHIFTGNNPDVWIDKKRWSIGEKITSCHVCGREPADPNERTGINCQYFIDTGSSLTKENALYVITDSTGIFGKYEIKFGKPVDYGICDSLWEINSSNRRNAKPENILPQLNYANVVPAAEIKVGDYDDNEMRCKSFDKMAETAEGLNALAVLKADVDNMGSVFSNGFGNVMSISRNAAMSRMLNQFFAGKIPLMLMDKKYENLYTVFAGGDDLSIIGPWNRIVDFAVDLRKAFMACTCNNPSLTISAGITFFKTGFPVYRAVDLAQVALDSAKHDGRNRINLFGLSMLWDTEFESQLKFATDWKTLLERHFDETEEGKEKKWATMLYRFLKYWQKYKEMENADNALEKLSHRFRFIYDIRRNIPVKKGKEDKWIGKEEPLKSLQIDLANRGGFEESALFKFLKVGLSLSMYSTRNTINNSINKENL